MYDLYLRGYSLRIVALEFGISEAAVSKMFKRRGYPTRPLGYLPYVEFEGRKYTIGDKGYYARTTDGTIKLHMDVWVYYNGEIPKGYDIHHIDEDKLNNNISNLELLTHSEHSKKPHKNR